MLKIENEIEKIKQILFEKFDIKEVFVFGSHACGDPDRHSDIDICVIADLNNVRKIEFIREIRRELAKYVDRSLDILVYSESEFRERAALQSTLENVILTNGLKLNG